MNEGGRVVKIPKKSVNVVYGCPLSRRRSCCGALVKMTYCRNLYLVVAKLVKEFAKGRHFSRVVFQFLKNEQKKTVKTINSAVLFLTKNGFGIYIAHYTSKSFHVNSRWISVRIFSFFGFLSKSCKNNYL